ncbi:hypothetical protein BKA80DRAFT_14906 [Phyllosticta citrichinensis]
MIRLLEGTRRQRSSDQEEHRMRESAIISGLYKRKVELFGSHITARNLTAADTLFGPSNSKMCLYVDEVRKFTNCRQKMPHMTTKRNYFPCNNRPSTYLYCPDAQPRDDIILGSMSVKDDCPLCPPKPERQHDSRRNSLVAEQMKWDGDNSQLTPRRHS